jgi:hypothetical protein
VGLGKKLPFLPTLGSAAFNPLQRLLQILVFLGGGALRTYPTPFLFLSILPRLKIAFCGQFRAFE